MARCTSPKARPAGSRASIRRPGTSRRSPVVCRQSIIGIGGAIDVAFIGKTAYVLVTLVGPDVGGSDVVGIYRVDGPDSFTVVADIGAFAVSNPPNTPFDVPTGVQYALETYRGGFLVTDGHHNRVLRVTLDGEVTELIAFGNIVPTGLAVSGQHGVHGRGRPRPPPARGRQGGVVRAEVAHRHGGGLRRPPPRRRGVWPRSHALRPLAGRLRSAALRVLRRCRTPARS